MNHRIIDGGEALMKVAKEISGEAGLNRDGRQAQGPLVMRTHELIGALNTAIAAGVDARMARHWMPIIQGHTVRADVLPVVREITGEVGDRFERLEGWHKGQTFEVDSAKLDGRLVMPEVGNEQSVWVVTLQELRDPSLFRFISSAAERAAAKVAIADAGEAPAEMAVQSPDDDIDSPAADRQIEFTIPHAVDMLAELHQAIDKLARSWVAFSVEDRVNFEHVDRNVHKVCALAGVEVPVRCRPAAPNPGHAYGLVHAYDASGKLTMCGISSRPRDVPIGEWRTSVECHACRVACGSLPRGGR